MISISNKEDINKYELSLQTKFSKLSISEQNNKQLFFEKTIGVHKKPDTILWILIQESCIKRVS